jgi:hypothetical protein
MRAAGLTRPGRTLNRKEKRTVDNRQSKPTGPVPSRGSLIYNGVLGVAALIATLWILSGAETGREFAGAVLGMMLSLGLLATAATGAIARSLAAMTSQRETLEEAIEEAGYTVEDGRAWLEREPGSPFYKPGPY